MLQHGRCNRVRRVDTLAAAGRTFGTFRMGCENASLGGSSASASARACNGGLAEVSVQMWPGSGADVARSSRSPGCRAGIGVGREPLSWPCGPASRGVIASDALDLARGPSSVGGKWVVAGTLYSKLL